jgi:hypothetical protein
VFLTKGTSFVSRAIRFFTRRIGEKRSEANHVGIIVEEGTVHSAIAVEALALVRRHALHRYAAKEKTKVAVFRPINLTEGEKEKIVTKANSYVGRKYGVLKIVTHALDWTLQGAYVFRRLTNEDNYPICSWVVAHAFKAADKNFGVEAGAASPDDIWDFVTKDENSDKYEQVRDLKPIPTELRVPSPV